MAHLGVRRSRIDITAIVAKTLNAAPFKDGHVRCYTYRELAQVVYGGDAPWRHEPTAAQLSAVRRAGARLVAEGRAERDGRQRADWDDPFARTHVRRLKKRDGWPEQVFRNPGGVFIRRPLTPDERAEAERREQSFSELLADAMARSRRSNP